MAVLYSANTLHIVTICYVMWFVPLYEFDVLLGVWYNVMRLYCYAMGIGHYVLCIYHYAMCVCYLLIMVKYYVNFNLFITFCAFPNTFCGHLISFCHYGWLMPYILDQ